MPHPTSHIEQEQRLALITAQKDLSEKTGITLRIEFPGNGTARLYFDDASLVKNLQQASTAPLNLRTQGSNCFTLPVAEMAKLLENAAKSMPATPAASSSRVPG